MDMGIFLPNLSNGWLITAAAPPFESDYDNVLAVVQKSEEWGGAGDGVASLSLRISRDVDWTAFGVWLTALLHRHGADVLRVKGLPQAPDASGPIVLHGVQNMIHPPQHLDEWPDSDHSSRLVFIVRDLEPERIRRSLLVFMSAAQGRALEVDAV